MLSYGGRTNVSALDGVSVHSLDVQRKDFGKIDIVTVRQNWQFLNPFTLPASRFNSAHALVMCVIIFSDLSF